jgi:hypothetical protein
MKSDQIFFPPAAREHETYDHEPIGAFMGSNRDLDELNDSKEQLNASPDFKQNIEQQNATILSGASQTRERAPA